MLVGGGGGCALMCSHKHKGDGSAALRAGNVCRVQVRVCVCVAHAKLCKFRIPVAKGCALVSWRLNLPLAAPAALLGLLALLLAAVIQCCVL